jgi:hypothetical protein
LSRNFGSFRNNPHEIFELTDLKIILLVYTFEQFGTANNFSFTVANILTAATDPLTPAIGLSVGGFTINDAVLEIFGGSFCFSFSSADAFTCGVVTPGAFALFANPTAPGSYSSGIHIAIGGFPDIDRLTISEVSTVIPEPTSLVLLGTVVAGLAWRLRRKQFSR